MQEFYIINKAHPTDIHRDISLIFIELQKYKPADKGSKAIKDLWLKFLTQIDENTVDVEEAMLENPEISQALNIVERSSYTDADLYVYEDYLLEVMTQRNSVLSAKNEGRAEGRTEQLVDSVKKFTSKGFDFDEVVKVLEIPQQQIDELRRLVFN